MPTELPSFPCACCGYLTLSEGTHDTFEVCPICFWEDDFLQFRNPDMEGGANRESLREAQANFVRYGACDGPGNPHVRTPTDGDRRAVDWAPLQDG
jgi:hypothetical protein